ncbi:aminoglycoside phosphotransferase family protein [Paenibacillus dokdonensis]|uniref:Aminoglycoside phosphotransferase family protein n=1 Tax=Paenibacillus dokdonensis TaxID=2567944 RepID=A0ABU6GWH1_9BACL|nr:aminoglycoside phosphotransferase family protein [Paenibacillus dokdonensis]MEC0242726.1 aminoglycoside phosphotransferase family protein [Paenibacillus dokdonensis]
MAAYKKPTVEISEVKAVLRKHFSSDVTAITPLEGGNISAVFSFTFFDKEYIIKFCDLAEGFETNKFISNLLSSQGIPFARCMVLGNFKSLNYLISEKIAGQILNSFSYEQQHRMLPEVLQILTRMNKVKLEATKGYGMINSSGNGTYNSWREHIIATNAEEQADSFWEGWHSLFKTTCLEKDVFDECYNRLLAYSIYNEPHRHFIHGDFHQYNILSDGQRITGVIDSNGKYGDFLIDLATLDWHIKTHLNLDVVQIYLNYQQEMGIEIPNFKERFIGAKYYNGLIGLRFYSKMEWNDSYYELRDELLSLI